MRFQVSAQDDPGVDILAVQLEDFEFQLTVVHQDVVPGGQRFVQPGDVKRDEDCPLTHMIRVFGGAEGDDLVGLQRHDILLQFANAQFGALQVH